MVREDLLNVHKLERALLRLLQAAARNRQAHESSPNGDMRSLWCIEATDLVQLFVQRYHSDQAFEPPSLQQYHSLQFSRLSAVLSRLNKRGLLSSSQ
jgi:hypothetical protein